MFRTVRNPEAQYRAFLWIFALISVLLLVGSAALIAYVVNNGRLFPEPPGPQAPFTGYNPGPTEDYLKTESLQAGAAYVQQYPEPQNVQVLKGMNTAQIYGYMVQQFAGGLKQDCTTCHNINNFAEDANPNKLVARQMLVMTADLNQNWVATLPADAGGKQITCATCHNGQLNNIATYPPDQSPLPQNWAIPFDNLESIKVTGERNAQTGKMDAELGEVQQNQYLMNHMNYSLGVGCAFCHNARYFPSYEIPQKTYAYTMLQMSKHINDNYKGIMNGKTPSCWMCHQGNYLPPGSVSDPGAPPVSVNPN